MLLYGGGRCALLVESGLKSVEEALEEAERVLREEIDFVLITPHLSSLPSRIRRRVSPPPGLSFKFQIDVDD